MSAEATGTGREALARIIRPWTLCDDGGGFDHGSDRAADAILASDWYAAVVAEAKAEALREAAGDALSLVRLVEKDMAEQALSAWRSADARRGLSDHEALVVHADALTRWSERLRMALRGEDYRARVFPPGKGDTEGRERAPDPS